MILNIQQGFGLNVLEKLLEDMDLYKVKHTIQCSKSIQGKEKGLL